MALYRFVGAYSYCEDLPQKTLASFGQQIEISESLADECILHKRIDLVPEKVWAEEDVTPEELKKYSSAESHVSAPDAFKAKKLALLKAAQEYRAELAAEVSKQTATA